MHDARVRKFSGGVAAIALCCVGPAACDSAEGEAQSSAAFCVAAAAVMNEGTFDSSGAGVVDALRDLDTGALSDADQRAVASAIDTVEAEISKFDDGLAPDGWSTEPVATVVGRICSVEMTSFHVMP